MRLLKRAGLALLALLIVGAAVAGWGLSQMRPMGGQAKTITVPEQATCSQVAHLLAEAGVIRNPLLFTWAARYRKAERSFRPGEYLVDPSLNTGEIVANLAAGKGRIPGVKVTIPEGFTLKKIAARLDAAGITSQEAFLAAAKGTDLGRRYQTAFPLPKGTLEGYLFPETYRFEKGTPPEQIAQEMLEVFSERLYVPFARQIAGSPMSLHQLVTLASLVEAEAKVDEDRSLIASVYVNRLKKKMRLECDATVLYALGEHKSRVLYSDLEVDSPYNTYRHFGLPPGPICSPGEKSFQAALSPPRTDYLYYVARKDGSHIFSRTAEEHLQAKRTAQSP